MTPLEDSEDEVEVRELSREKTTNPQRRVNNKFIGSPFVYTQTFMYFLYVIK